MGKNYPIDRDKKGRYRHSFVFMRGATVTVKLADTEGVIKGIISTIEQYYFVVDVEEAGEKYQVTVNLGGVQYIKHDEFQTVEERSPKKAAEDLSTTFVFNVGEKIGCVFKNGKMLKGTLLSEGAYYLYIKSEKGSYYTIMKSALNYVRHKDHKPKLLLNDFYTEEMKAENYAKPTEFVLEEGHIVRVVFANGKELAGVVLDEEKHWILLVVEQGYQVTVLKEAFVYMKHNVTDTKAQLYMKNKRLRKQLCKLG
ncbi:hypothetical protein COE58_25830 [Bacillus cereus]|nr:hypothetical protein COE58_25830 [Bacillus cereus]